MYVCMYVYNISTLSILECVKSANCINKKLNYFQLNRHGTCTTVIHVHTKII